MGLFTAKARKTDPETSHEAAQSVKGISQTQVAVALTLLDGPMVDDELVARFMKTADEGLHKQATDQSIRSRRAELVAQGLVVWTGEHGLTRYGRRARIWTLADGVDFARIMKMAK